MATCCPQGYTYNPITQHCEKITSSLATFVGTPNAISKGLCIGYGNLGAVFHNDITSLAKPITASTTSINAPNPVDFSNFAVLLDGASNPVGIQTVVSPSLANLVWGVPSPLPSPLPPFCSIGRLNASSIWTPGYLGLREWIGHTFCINIPQTKTYYIGISGDDVVKLSLNNQLIIDLQGSGWNFTTWRVFPITLTAGNNVFKLEGYNSGSNAAMGMEVYDATLGQLTGVTTNAALAPYVLFSSVNLIGGSYTNGETFGYNCPEGCNLNVCTTPITCDCVEFVDPGVCCYSITNCETGITIVTPTDLSLYLGKIIKVDDSTNCWIVSPSAELDCQGGPEVEVVQEFDTCEECVQKCYVLVDCAGVNSNVVTNTDLSEYVGKVIKITTCPDTCWLVAQNSGCTGAVSVTVTNWYNNCALCSGVVPQEIILKTRSVYPNYGDSIRGCSIDYIEKVNCNFSEAAYHKIAAKRFGIKTCTDLDYDYWWVKKQLLELNLREDPEHCQQPVCENPCTDAVPVEPPVPVPTECPEVEDITTTFSYIENCQEVENVSIEFSFNHPVGNI